MQSTSSKKIFIGNSKHHANVPNATSFDKLFSAINCILPIGINNNISSASLYFDKMYLENSLGN